MEENLVPALIEELKSCIEEICGNAERMPVEGIPDLGLRCFRHSFEDFGAFSSLSAMLVLSGRKEVRTGGRLLSCGPGEVAVIPFELPLDYAIRDASREAPFDAFCLRLDPYILSEFAGMADEDASKPAEGSYAIGEAGYDLLDAFDRLLRLRDDPARRSIQLQPTRREIHYLLCRRARFRGLRELCVRGSPASKVARAVAWLKENYKKPVTVEELAGVAIMAPSTLHRHFRDFIGASPIQYQKRLRLQEARRLIGSVGLSVSAAAWDVGYQSVQQFCREYKRVYGVSPGKEVRAAQSG